MIDLHCHILPGVDDGPATLDDALALARAAVAAGTATVVATPHADPYHRVLAPARDRALRLLCDALQREEIPLRVVGGSEIALDLFIDLDPAARDGLRLGGGPYLLLECPLAQAAGVFDAYISRLLVEGERIVLAHPERCPTFHRHPERLAELVAEGALTAVTAGALVGRFGPTVQRFATAMVHDGLVHSVASDAHDARRRPPGMRQEIYDAGFGAMATWWTEDVPEAVLTGTMLPRRPRSTGATPRRRRWPRLRH